MNQIHTPSYRIDGMSFCVRVILPR